MKTIRALAAASVAVVIAGGAFAGVADAATAAKPTTTTAGQTTTVAHRPPARGWEASAGRYRTKTAATARQAKLAKKGLTGFVIEREPGKKAVYDVELTYPTRAEAQAEAAKIRKAGFKASTHQA